MSRLRTVFRCNDCGASAPKWTGRCPGCGRWNCLVEEHDDPTADALVVLGEADRAVPIAEVDAGDVRPCRTGVSEFDRVLGGGLVPGSVTLVGGEPGVGKSTLLLQVVSGLAAGATTLYVSAEESKAQVRSRAERLGTLRPRLYLASDTALPHLVGHLDQVRPAVAVVDSIQTVYDPVIGSAPGSVAQVRACAARLVQEAKARQVALVLVGHVTKDGDLAGPRVLEHLVDTVLTFDGDRHHSLRLLRAVKHRFGATDELGVMELTEEGLVGVDDPSSMFLADRSPGVPGSVVFPAIEGHRPVLVEIQALVTPSPLPAPRRSAHGLDQSRLSLLLAVLQERVGLNLAKSDVYASVVGGVKVTEPAADLAVALAVASAAGNRALPGAMVAFGEVGLGGEVRQVHQGARRSAEAARLGFEAVAMPALGPQPPPGLVADRVVHLGQALVRAGLADG